MAIRKVYNIDTGLVYSSAAKAALAVGVDPSNVLKVLKGARQSAGGYRFVYADNLTPEQLQTAAEKRLQQIPERLQQKQKQRRERRIREYTEARKAARQKLIDANKMISEGKKAGIYYSAPELQDLDQLRDEIGSSKSGLIDASVENLERMDLEDLQRIVYRTQELIERAQIEIDNRKGERESLAFEFGLSTGEEWSKYEKLEPELWRILKRAGEDEGRGSKPIFKILQDAIGQHVPRKALQDLIRRLDSYFDNSAHTARDLDNTVAAWYQKTFPAQQDAQPAQDEDFPEIPLAP